MKTKHPSIICPNCKGKDMYCRICAGTGRIPREKYTQVLQYLSKEKNGNTYARYSKRAENMILSGEYSIAELSRRLHRTYRAIEAKRRKLKQGRSEILGEKETGNDSDRTS